MDSRIARLELELIRLEGEIGRLKIRLIDGEVALRAAYMALSIATLGVLAGAMAIGFGWT